jgi:hypothetical protein
VAATPAQDLRTRAPQNPLAGNPGRGERGKWFADMLSGQELMMVSIFQKALKYRGGRFSYHLQLPAVVGNDEFDERKYESWLFSRCLVLRHRRRTFARDRLLDTTKQN